MDKKAEEQSRVFPLAPPAPRLSKKAYVAVGRRERAGSKEHTQRERERRRQPPTEQDGKIDFVKAHQPAGGGGGAFPLPLSLRSLTVCSITRHVLCACSSTTSICLPRSLRPWPRPPGGPRTSSRQTGPSSSSSLSPGFLFACRESPPP